MCKLQPETFSSIVYKTISVQMNLAGNFPLKNLAFSRKDDISHKKVPTPCIEFILVFVSTTCISSITGYNFEKAFGPTKASRKTYARISWKMSTDLSKFVLNIEFVIWSHDFIVDRTHDLSTGI